MDRKFKLKLKFWFRESEIDHAENSIKSNFYIHLLVMFSCESLFCFMEYQPAKSLSHFISRLIHRENNDFVPKARCLVTNTITISYTIYMIFK